MFFFRAVTDGQNTFETHAYMLCFIKKKGVGPLLKKVPSNKFWNHIGRVKLKKGSTTNHRTDIELNYIEAYVSSWKSVLFILVVRCIKLMPFKLQLSKGNQKDFMLEG